mgnify:CR=1 FL=1
MTFYRDEDGPYVSQHAGRSFSLYGSGIVYPEGLLCAPGSSQAELIDGQFYYMSSPGLIHQKLVGELYFQIKEYIRRKGGPCDVFLAPFDVFLDSDDRTVVQPD